MGRHFLRNSVKLFLFIFLANTEHLTFCIHIKNAPSDYKHYGTVDLREICSYHSSPTINLKNPKNAVIIFLEKSNGLPDYAQEDWICQFIVKSNHEKINKLVASVQSIAFDEIGYCPSYIKFMYNHDGNTVSTDRICGFSRRSTPNDFWSLFSPRDYGFSYPDSLFNKSDVKYGIYNKDGKITTKIVIPKGQPLRNALTGLVIVYTEYEPSNVYVETVPPYNIYMQREYICDGVQNCHDICRDEENCPMSLTWITIYTLMIFSALIIVFLIIMHYRKKLCFPNRNATINSQNDRRTTEVPNSFGNRAIDDIRNVPSDFECPPSPDAPPSYDSLFPNGTDPWTR